MSTKYIAVGLLIVVIIGRLISKSAKTGFGNLGLVSGLALGLSASPVLAATITAVFTLAGVLVPIYFRPHLGGLGSKDVAAHDPQQWLGPLAGWLAVGLIFGIFLRANDALNFSENLRSRYHAQGFNEEQVDNIMAGQTSALAKEAREKPDPQNKTNLQSSERAEKWAKLLSDLVRPNDKPDANLDRVKNAATQDDLDRIRALESGGMSATQILDVLKTWHSKEPEGKKE